MAALVDTRMPGVFTVEVPTIPPSVALVPTAVPVFIGYTMKAEKNGVALTTPTRVRNMREYISWFGEAPKQKINLQLEDRNATGEGISVKVTSLETVKYRMYYAMQLFYANGGGPCFILSLGPDDSAGDPYTPALFNKLKKVKDITIIVMPDAVKSANYNSAVQQSLLHCSTAVNRVTLLDVDDASGEDNDKITQNFRSVVPAQIEQKKYGAAYYPFLNTTLDYVFDATSITIVNHLIFDDAQPPVSTDGSHKNKTIDNFKDSDNLLYNKAIETVRNYPLALPPSPAIAGLYVATDLNQGVWKAPANASLAAVTSPTVEIDDDLHANLNVDATSGKSVNAIRAYTGRGILVFGARTLAGNDLEWRYVNVRRTFCFIEDAISRAMQDFVFASNTRDTWIKVKSMISNFLLEIWKAGGLFGNTPKEAFQVNVGQPETMTDVDILEGRMIVEIKLRVSRPAEFIIMRYEHKFNVTNN